MPTPLTLADLTPTILGLADTLRADGRMPTVDVKATVRGGATLAPLLAVEAALREAGLGACELVWVWSSEATRVELQLRIFDGARRPLLTRTFELALELRREQADA